MAWVFPDEATEATGRLLDALTDGRAFVPALWPIEVANVLFATRRGRIAETDWSRIRRNLEALPIRIDPVSTSRIWGAALEVAHNPSPLRLRRHVPGAGDPDTVAARHAEPHACRRWKGSGARGADRGLTEMYRPTLGVFVTLLTGVVIGVLAGGCSSLPSDTGEAMTFRFDFDEGPLGFVAGFADYPPAHEEIYELTSGHRALPAPLESQSGLFISGVNRSDDLFMFFKGPIVGLTPGASYAVEVSVEIATSTPAGCFGVGGAPGESVSIKAGVTAEEPVAVMDDSYLRMNIDIGSQSNSGTQAVVLGNVANSRQCEQPREWELKALESESAPAGISVPADGRVWLLIGADSGFESRTDVYFTRASVTLTPSQGGVIGGGLRPQSVLGGRGVRVLADHAALYGAADSILCQSFDSVLSSLASTHTCPPALCSWP